MVPDNLSYPIAFGLAGGHLGIAEEAITTAYLRQSLAGLISACQRLMPLGQIAASCMIWNLKASHNRRGACLGEQGDWMLHPAAGTGVHAPRLARNPAVYQLAARLAVRFESEEGRTRVHVDTQQPPWRVVRGFSQDNGGSLVHLHNVSGGILSGDRLNLEINLGPESVAQVTTTGATRLYRHRAGAPDSEQHVKIQVGEGALLEYLPDALIPFAGSRHRQYTSISLAKCATLFAWDVLAPGRQAMGETFVFDSLRIQTELRSGYRPLVIENLMLDPVQRPLDSAARLGPYTHIANFYACSEGVPSSKWRELESQMNDFCSAHSRPGVMIWGASTLVADGIAVRGLSFSARDVPATLAAIWSIAKRFLTGEDAILPRKVY